MLVNGRGMKVQEHEVPPCLQRLGELRSFHQACPGSFRRSAVITWFTDKTKLDKPNQTMLQEGRNIRLKHLTVGLISSVYLEDAKFILGLKQTLTSSYNHHFVRNAISVFLGDSTFVCTVHSW